LNNKYLQDSKYKNNTRNQDTSLEKSKTANNTENDIAVLISNEKVKSLNDIKLYRDESFGAPVLADTSPHGSGISCKLSPHQIIMGLNTKKTPKSSFSPNSSSPKRPDSILDNSIIHGRNRETRINSNVLSSSFEIATR
jgi:hypothetical protein